jgi:hypothetical protein
MRPIGEEVKASKRKDKKHKPRRWVVERTISWLNRCCGILVRYEKKAENYRAAVQLACALLWYRRVSGSRLEMASKSAKGRIHDVTKGLLQNFVPPSSQAHRGTAGAKRAGKLRNRTLRGVLNKAPDGPPPPARGRVG